nr:MAG TPA: hypothetical protein [Bacteriophage sp.]
MMKAERIQTTARNLSNVIWKCGQQAESYKLKCTASV